MQLRNVLEVIRDAITQVRGLPHIDDTTVFVLELIRTWTCRNRASRGPLDRHFYFLTATARFAGAFFVAAFLATVFFGAGAFGATDFANFFATGLTTFGVGIAF